MTSALVLTGAPGAGKTSVLEALCTRLELDGTTYGAIESEQLGWGWPWLPAEDWLPQLAAVIALQRRAGRERHLVAATTQTASELVGVVQAVGADRVLVVCLAAPPGVVAARLDAREPDRWPGKAALIARARVLAETIPALAGVDLVIDTDGTDAMDVAVRIRDAMRDGGLVGRDAGAAGA